MDNENKEDLVEDIELTGEDNVDELEIETEEEIAGDKIKEVKAKLKTCEQEKTSLMDDLQRTKADFLNSKRRLEEQSRANTERSLNNFLESLLPLCDSFDMAFADESAWAAVDESWRKGVEGIKSQLDSILKQHNVTEIKALDEMFDPEKHDAVSSRDDEKETDIVIEVMQKGYERNESIIRPAKVVIQD